MESRFLICLSDRLESPFSYGYPSIVRPIMKFGRTTVLLNIHNAGFFGLDAMILAMRIFFGGMAQVINESFGKEILPIGEVN